MNSELKMKNEMKWNEKEEKKIGIEKLSEKLFSAIEFSDKFWHSYISLKTLNTLGTFLKQ